MRPFNRTENLSQAQTSADLVEVITEVVPDARPLQTNTTHVVIGDLHNLLQTEHARVGRYS